MSTLTVFIFVLVLNLLLAQSPFYMNVWLVLVSSLLAFWGLALSNKWTFSILVIFFLGGLMVLFAYLISLVKSKEVQMHVQFFWLLPLAYFLSPCLTTQMNSDFKLNLMHVGNSYILFLLVATLLLLLLIINKVTLKNQGPLSFKTHD